MSASKGSSNELLKMPLHLQLRLLSRDDQNFKAKYDLEYEISPLASPRTTKLTASESHYPELQASIIENHIDVYSHTSKTLRHGKIYYHLK